MTEISEKTKKVPPAVERFILQWGDMGSQWGVNRSVSQIHALLYLSERPLTADYQQATRHEHGAAQPAVATTLLELCPRRAPLSFPYLDGRRSR